jgi:hypothetical protein
MDPRTSRWRRWIGRLVAAWAGVGAAITAAALLPTAAWAAHPAGLAVGDAVTRRYYSRGPLGFIGGCCCLVVVLIIVGVVLLVRRRGGGGPGQPPGYPQG